MIKKLLASVFLFTALMASACWFTEANFNATYISGVNNYFVHYDEAADIEEAVYYNGMTVAMPLTVWVKVSDREADQQGEVAGTKPIIRAMLQYRVLPAGSWVTVKDYNNPDWDMNFTGAVPLFGSNCIDLNLPNGTEILIRLYLSDGIYETGYLSELVTDYIPDIATFQSGGVYSGGWSAPHIMRLKITGRRPFR